MKKYSLPMPAPRYLSAVMFFFCEETPLNFQDHSVGVEPLFVQIHSSRGVNSAVVVVVVVVFVFDAARWANRALAAHLTLLWASILLYWAFSRRFAIDAVDVRVCWVFHFFVLFARAGVTWYVLVADEFSRTGRGNGSPTTDGLIR